MLDASCCHIEEASWIPQGYALVRLLEKEAAGVQFVHLCFSLRPQTMPEAATGQREPCMHAVC